MYLFIDPSFKVMDERYLIFYDIIEESLWSNDNTLCEDPEMLWRGSDLKKKKGGVQDIIFAYFTKILPKHRIKKKKIKGEGHSQNLPLVLASIQVVMNISILYEI